VTYGDVAPSGGGTGTRADNLCDQGGLLMPKVVGDGKNRKMKLNSCYTES